MNRWRTIGVLGGMGPAATADFLARLAANSGAVDDSEQPRVLIDSNPYVPDRNAARAGVGESPGPALAAMARGLVAAGAEVLAMPCNAAHGWALDASTATTVPFVDMIEAAVAEVAALQPRPRAVGLLAVAATLDGRIYHHRLEDAGIAVVECDRTGLQDLVSRIKAGDTGANVAIAMRALAADLAARGAEAIIAACTEVPLVLAAAAVPVPFIDATASLVRATLLAARS